MPEDDEKPRILVGEVLPPEKPESRRKRRERKRWAWLERPTRGQPSKLTPSRLRRMIESRELGDSITDACRAVGITPKTHDNWMERGRKDDEAGSPTLYAEYFRRIPGAERRGKVERNAFILRKIRAGGTDNLAQAREMMRYDAQIESGRLGRATLRLKREVLKASLPPAPPALPKEQAAPVNLSLLSTEEWADFQRIDMQMRTDFASVSPADVARLQAYVRKARGQSPQDNPEVETPP